MRKFYFVPLSVFLTLGLLFSSAAWAQDSSKDDKDQGPFEAREAVGTVLLSGLVGGILGLSTLSFYDEPQDHIRNITLGAGIGMLVSVIYLTAQAATTPVQVDEDGAKNKPGAFIYPSFEPSGRFALNGTFRF